MCELLFIIAKQTGRICYRCVNSRTTTWSKHQHVKLLSSRTMAFIRSLFLSLFSLLLLSQKQMAVRILLRVRTGLRSNRKLWLSLRIASAQRWISRSSMRTNRGRTLLLREMVLIHRDFLSTEISRDQPCAKLAPRWLGPFKVLEVPNMATVRVQLPRSCKAHPVFNVAALRHFHEDVSLRGIPEEPPAPVLDLDGQDRYLVEEILSERVFKGKVQYLVKWIGYNESTWEPRANVLDESGTPIVPLQKFLEAKGRRG